MAVDPIERAERSGITRLGNRYTSVQIQGLDEVLAMLKSLPPEIVSKRGGPIRQALRKGALVIVEQARTNFRAAVALAGKTGITDSTGFTASKIVARRRQPPAGTNGEKYVVTVAGAKHPSGKRVRNKPIQANDIAFIMEAGSASQQATPWLRPAYRKTARIAIDVIERETIQAVGRAARKAAKLRGM